MEGTAPRYRRYLDTLQIIAGIGFLLAAIATPFIPFESGPGSSNFAWVGIYLFVLIPTSAVLSGIGVGLLFRRMWVVGRVWIAVVVSILWALGLYTLLEFGHIL